MRYKICILKTEKYWSKKPKAQINGERCHIHGSENLKTGGFKNCGEILNAITILKLKS